MNNITSKLSALPLLSSFNSDSFGIDRLRTETGNIRSRFANFKSLTDFFDIKRMSKPQGWGDAQGRINFNLSYFSTNYAVVFSMLSIYSLLTNLLLLFVIIFVVLGMIGISYLGGEDLDLKFTTIKSSSLYTVLFVIAVPLGIFASPLSTMLWLIGASGVTILGHATIMEKPIESAFAEEQV